LPGGTNLFNSAVVFENYPFDEQAIAHNGLHIRETQAIDTTNFALTAVVFLDQQLSIDLGYDSALFDTATIQRMITHLHRLLEGITAQPDRSLAQLPWMSDAECHQVLVEWNDTNCELPAGTVTSLFTAQVARTPQAIAVVSDEGSLSYAELDARANRLAHRLVRLGVGPECPVGLLMERSVDVVVAELAIVKAGGAYVPVDVRAPVSRMRLLLAQTKASVLVTDEVWATTAQHIHDGHRVVVDADSAGLDEPADAPLVQVRPDNLVYVMYTSGSTGTPKGVAVRHRDVVALALARCFAGGGHERVLLHSPQAFDASTYELWVPLLTGGQVVVAPPGELTVELLRHAIT
ncbi:MAG: AMP-binding protein, partial [Actinobacteria bacterium]|nr:AMP-binding protein [Actinomycetota bacterium]